MSLSEVLLRAGACLVWGALGLYLMLPRGQAGTNTPWRWVGAALILLSFGLLLVVPSSATELTPAILGLAGSISFDVTYWVMAVVSLGSAVMMITSRNPVYSALWFAMVLLANAGLYALHDAQFLAAATIIVYAGAVVVTFLFVVMLAQPMGASTYDRLTREPFLATCVAGLILGVTLLSVIQYSRLTEAAGAKATSVSARPDLGLIGHVVNQNPESRISDKHKHVDGLGRALFLEHYVSVEVIGVLLLAAVVGAMLIATHRMETIHTLEPPASKTT